MCSYTNVSLNVWIKPIHLPHLSSTVNAVILAMAISHSCPDLVPLSIASYGWSLLAGVVGK